MTGKIIYLAILSLLATPVIAEGEQDLEVRPGEEADTCDESIAQVRVALDNVGPGGLLTVELYNDPKHFLRKKGRLKRIRIPAEHEQHRVCFNLEESGSYAVVAYHDLDANRKLKKKWNMMPKEPFGLSMNPEPKFGFPKFEDSAFSTDELGKNIEIRLIDP